MNIIELNKQFMADPECRQYLIEYSAALSRAMIETHQFETLQDVALSTDPEAVGEFYQRFWENLPDNKAIRTQPFFIICSICEKWMEGAESE